MVESQQSKIAFIGGEGFIGRNLTLYFSRRHECFSFGERESLFPSRQDTLIRANPYKEKIKNQYGAIVHLVDNRQCDPEHFLAEEKNLADNLTLNDKNHLILFSSAVVYANPDSEYGVRKRILEEFYSEYCKENGVKLTILRLFNTFGPFQMPYRQGSLVANIICNHIIGKETEINDRHSERDFLYAGDIPKFVEYFLENKLTGTFDLGSGKLTSISDIISILETQTLKTHLTIIDKNRADEIVSPAANNPFLDAVSLTDVSEALSQTVDFYRHNIDIVKRYVH